MTYIINISQINWKELSGKKQKLSNSIKKLHVDYNLLLAINAKLAKQLISNIHSIYWLKHPQLTTFSFSRFSVSTVNNKPFSFEKLLSDVALVIRRIRNKPPENWMPSYRILLVIIPIVP